MKIILIDDDSIAMENIFLTIQLDLPSFEVRQFSYPEEFEKAKIDDIAIVLLDIMFAGDGEFEGGFDLGLKFYRKFKEINQSVPVIIFTNKTRASIEVKEIIYIENNHDVILEKPTISMESIILTIKQLLRIVPTENQ